jgi:hypothetical protein
MLLESKVWTLFSGWGYGGKLVTLSGLLVVFYMTLKHPRVLPALSEFGIFYPIATAPPDLAPAHNF